MLLLLSLVPTLSALQPQSMGRRAAVQGAAAAAAIYSRSPCSAAQRGAEDPYATQRFEQSTVCIRRTLLGACAETEIASVPNVEAAPRQQLPAPSAATTESEFVDSPLVQSMLQRTKDNADVNSRIVKEKTLAAGMSGVYGPFSKDAAIMRSDGSFDVVPLKRYDELKDKGRLTRTKTGLDAYVPGFDPDAPEPTREKFLGLF
jgi:hypothetical protein